MLMPTITPSRRLARPSLLALGAAIALASSTIASDDIRTATAWGSGWPMNTTLAPKQTAVGRVDLDSDINCDGMISNDGSDSGDLESSPPGQIIGPKLMTKFLFRITPLNTVNSSKGAQADFDIDHLVVSLELRLLTIGRKTSGSPDAENAKAGHLRVWSDEQGTTLLLDSRDPAKRRIEWDLNAPKAPAYVYVECAEPSSASNLFALVLELDNSSRKGFADKKISPAAARDWVLISCKNESPEIESADGAKKPKRAPGFGNYASFSKGDVDAKNIWVTPPAHPKG